MGKFCKDCKWAQPTFLPPRYRFATCAHSSVKNAEFLVTGRSENYCTIERIYGECGKSGKNWEPEK